MNTITIPSSGAAVAPLRPPAASERVLALRHQARDHALGAEWWSRPPGAIQLLGRALLEAAGLAVLREVVQQVERRGGKERAAALLRLWQAERLIEGNQKG